MSNSVQPHRWQPTRLPHPWDSPGKNTGVGCHFLLQCMNVKNESEVIQSCLTLSDPMDCRLPGSSTHGIFQARVLEWVAIAFSDIGCYLLANKKILLLFFHGHGLKRAVSRGQQQGRDREQCCAVGRDLNRISLETRIPRCYPSSIMGCFCDLGQGINSSSP